MKLPRLISFVYVIYDRDRFHTAKIGKADVPTNRLRGIKQSIKNETGNTSDAVLFFYFPTFRPYKVENALHRFLYPADRRAKGSGKTEWFKYLNVYTMLFVYILGYWLGLPNDYLGFACGVSLLIPRPFDFALLVFFLCAVEWVVVLGGLWLVWLLMSC